MRSLAKFLAKEADTRARVEQVKRKPTEKTYTRGLHRLREDPHP
jgi:hypothetical protein